jgi:hypothetical protein
VSDQAEFPKTHNYAALPLDEQAQIAIDDALAPAKKRWDALEASFGRAPATIDEEFVAEQVTTLIAQMGALVKAIEIAHAGAKDPFLQAGRLVDGVKNALYEKVDVARRALQARLTAYQTAKQTRIEAERAALRAADEEKGDPEPGIQPQADHRVVTIRSGEGASAHLADDIDVEILDVKRIPKRYLERPKVLAAIKAELKPDLKKGDTIAGAKGVKKQQSRVRRG